MTSSSAPTAKWWAAQVSALGAWLSALILNDWHFSQQIEVALVALVVQGVVTYVAPSRGTAPAGT
jgi:hypothetical protein